jgi:small-conductance mechanosensitive channel
MTKPEFLLLFRELWADVQSPEVIWQVAALAGSLAIAWFAASFIQRREIDTGASDVARLGVGGLRRVAFPLIAVTLVYLTRGFVSTVTAVNLLNIAVPLLLSLALVRMAVYVLRLAFSPSGWLAASEKVIAALIWGSFALYLTGLSPFLIQLLRQVEIPLGKDTVDLWVVLRGLFMVVVTVFAALWVAGLVERRLMAAQSVDSSVRAVLARLFKALFILVAVLAGLSMVGIDITALSVFGGALGVGLGFGLQKIASNYVSGFIILLDRSIQIGNVITLDPTTGGVVTQITTRYTVVRTLGGLEFIVPNEVLVGTIVQNQTRSDTRVRLAVQVGIAYSSDLPRVLELCVEVAKRHPRVLADPPPRALVVAFADSGINLEVGFWIDDPQNGTGGVRSDISVALWEAFREHGVQIPFPQREVRLLGPQPAPAA